jgi:hypothetical protein
MNLKSYINYYTQFFPARNQSNFLTFQSFWITTIKICLLTYLSNYDILLLIFNKYLLNINNTS